MTKEQIHLIRSSWNAIKPMAESAGQLFYEKLFATAPGIRHLFAADIRPQAGKLIQVLGYIVAHIDTPETLVAGIEELGRRHAGYGAKPSHFEIVGECLLETLQEGLQDAWTPDVQDAWTNAFYRIKEIMIVAMETRTELVSASAFND